MPQKPEGGWPNVQPDVAEAMVNKIGNQALLQATSNSLIGNASFSQKVKVFAKSGLLWTKGLAKYSDWGANEIASRQADMAKRVSDIWSLKA